jgi:class 3 adenylate cyclase
MERSVWLARIDAMTAALSMPPLLGTALPARDRTILTTDIVGSTGTNARLGDALYVEQLRVHDRLFRSRLVELRGTEIKHTGDGFNAFFDDPADAIRCALAFQDDLVEWARVEPELALAARCGAATGQTVPTGGDLHGLLQAQAARICAAAAPGEVVTSSTTAALVADQGFVITSRGRHQLKGLPEAIEILQIRQA